jgi:hypothetical protein
MPVAIDEDPDLPNIVSGQPAAVRAPDLFCSGEDAMRTHALLIDSCLREFLRKVCLIAGFFIGASLLHPYFIFIFIFNLILIILNNKDMILCIICMVYYTI